MDAEQKKRAREAIDGWNSNKIIEQAAAAYSMAELLQELLDVPEQAGVPVCRVSGYFGGYLTAETIDKAAVLPNGMALYAAPQAQAVQAAGVPDGWKLVPIEPTNGMRDAGHRAAWRRIPSLFDEGDAANVYLAMLAAAPQPPAFDHDAMAVFAANRFHVKPCDKRLFGWQVTAGDGEQTLYVGRKPDCENVARRLAGAFLDGAFYYSKLAAAPAVQPAPK